MDPATLDRLQSEFPGCIWALWSETFPEADCIEGDCERFTAFIHANRDRLNDRVVLISLNPSTHDPPGYLKVHLTAARHYDSRLKAFIQDNGLENIIGAYMTDIVPDVVDRDSNQVSPENVDVERFIEQLRVLGNEEYDVIYFSRQAFETLQMYFAAEPMELRYELSGFDASTDEFTVSVYRVWHYSNYGANQDKVGKLKQQLRYLNDEMLNPRSAD